jgi:hypothetical protein
VSLLYSELVAETKAYLTVTLDLKEPVQIEDFSALFAGMGGQFDRYLAEHHPKLKGEAKMFVKEVREGSIVFDLIAHIKDMIGLMDATLVIGGFGSLFSKRIRTLMGGEFIPNASKGDIEEIGKTVRALSKDAGGEMRLERVAYEKGVLQKRLLLEFGTAQARRAEETLAEQTKVIDAVSHVDYSRKLMTFERSRKSDTDLEKPTGELVIIEEVVPQPKALIYGSDLVEQQIKHEIREADDNIYKKGFIVDANARLRAGRIIGYVVTAVHQVIDLGDDDDSQPKLQG